jgi:hypothetical protein
LFVFIIGGFFFSLYYQLHLHYLLIPILTPFTLPPSLVLQSIAVLPNYSFCPFSSILSPGFHLLLPPYHNLSPDFPSHLYSLHLVINLLYQTYSTLTPAIPDTSTYTTTTESYPNTHKGCKTLQLP